MIAQPTGHAAKSWTLPAAPTFVECTQCGYEPVDQFSTKQRCPKCGGFSWHRLPRAGALVTVADAQGLQCLVDEHPRDQVRRAG